MIRRVARVYGFAESAAGRHPDRDTERGRHGGDPDHGHRRRLHDPARAGEPTAAGMAARREFPLLSSRSRNWLGPEDSVTASQWGHSIASR